MKTYNPQNTPSPPGAWNISKLKSGYVALIAFAILTVGLAAQKPGGISDKPRTTAQPEAVVTEKAAPQKEPSFSESATIESLRRDNAALRQQLQAQPVRVEKALPVEKPTSRKSTDSNSQQAIGFAGPKESLSDFKDGDDSSSKLSYTISSTGKRHNSNCRYFHSAKSRPCGPTSGVACKVCGG